MRRWTSKPPSAADQRASPYPQALTIPRHPNPRSPGFAENTRIVTKDSENRAVYIFSTLSKNYMDPFEETCQADREVIPGARASRKNRGQI